MTQRRPPQDFLTQEGLEKLSKIEWKLERNIERRKELNRDSTVHPIISAMAMSRLTVEQDRLLDERGCLLGGREYLIPQEGQVECPQANSSNQFYLTIDSWGIVFAGKAKDVGMKPTNGGRAIAYLLKVGTPKGGPAEVWSAMVPDGQQVLAEAREEFGAQEFADSRTLVTVRQQLKEVEEKLELEDVQVEEREKLEDEKADIESYLAGVEGLGGGSRTWGGRGAGPAVGTAIRRAMKMLEKIHPELHTHLKDAIKEQYGQNVRYVRTKGMPHWNVRGI